jgi:hypothetical protein
MARRLLSFPFLALIWGLFFVPFAQAGFGITPPYVRNDSLRPGSEYTQEIIIVRSDPVEDLNAELTLNLPGIESWFSFDRGLRFILPRGESQVKMNVTVRVPEARRLQRKYSNSHLVFAGSDDGGFPSSRRADRRNAIR